MIDATTGKAQIHGPVCVKPAIRRAGEMRQTVAEDDAWASEGRPIHGFAIHTPDGDVRGEDGGLKGGC